MQITVQKIWPFNPKYISFKGTDGRDYKGEPWLHSKLQEGMTIDVEVKPSNYTGKDGNPKTTYWLPKDFTLPSNGAPAAPPPPLNGSYNQVPRDIHGNVHKAALAEMGNPPTRPLANGSYSEVEKSGYIFVTGCLQQALSAGLQAKDIPVVAETLVAAWNDHVKGKV